MVHGLGNLRPISDQWATGPPMIRHPDHEGQDELLEAPDKGKQSPGKQSRHHQRDEHAPRQRRPRLWRTKGRKAGDNSPASHNSSQVLDATSFGIAFIRWRYGPSLILPHALERSS